MTIAISILEKRVAPVFDTARGICLVECGAGDTTTRTFCRFENDDLHDKIAWLSASGAHTLICGAVSQPVRHALSAAGIRTVPFVCGELDEVIAAFLEDTLTSNVFAMPGCRRCRRMRGGRRGQGRGRNQLIPPPCSGKRRRSGITNT